MTKNENQIIELAIQILESNLRQKGEAYTNPERTKNLLRLKLELLEHEVFVVVFLDTRHYLIEIRELFHGTIDVASVYPREVVKAALNVNAAAVIFAHNHPSGTSTPSEADRRLTKRLREALALVDIRTLDHIVIGHGEQTSFSELGWI